MPIACFLLEPTGRSVRALRRYFTSADNLVREANRCLPQGYHDAQVPLDVVEADVDARAVVSGDLWPHDDPRWPATCACGYVFTTDDAWQVFCQSEYRRTDTGELMTLQSSPPGAMWWAPWLAGEWGGEAYRTSRAGQPHLIVKTPAGEWDVDGPSSNNNAAGWTRTGEPPLVTARPSIGIGEPFRFHAYLTDGVLVEC